MKTVLKKQCILLIILPLLLSVGATVQANEVTVYKNPDAKIVLDGQELRFADGGKSLDILMLDGVAYVPLMQLSKALGKEITWNQQDRTFYIGFQPGGVDMIDDFLPYERLYHAYVYQTKKDKKVNIANKEYSKYINVYQEGKLYYNLEGKFSTVSFLAYSPTGSTIKIYGDNNALLYEAEIGAKDLPTSHNVDIRGVFKFVIHQSRAYSDLYIVELFAHK